MWKWLMRALGAVPREEWGGASLAPGQCWMVSAPTPNGEFVRRLRDLLPPRSVLYLEGGTPDRVILEFFDARACEPQLKLALGTIWPRPAIYHVPATPENLAELAGLFESRAAPEICVHFHAYWEQTVVLQWHDAFCKDPLLLSPLITEPRVKAFCAACACSYNIHTLGPEYAGK